MRPPGGMPLVSVIMPCHNAARYIGDAIHSLTMQFSDPRDIEIVVVDDGSTDGTGEIAERCARGLPLLKSVRLETARGPYRARNRGMESASGRYISFLDADDWFAPGHLAALAAHMDRLDCDFLRTDVIKARGTERVFKRAPQGRRGTALDPRDSILPAGTYTMVDHPWSQAGMYHRRLLESGLLLFPEDAITAQDRPWIWRLHLKAGSYAVVDSPGFIWRKDVSTSLTSVVDERRLGYLSALSQVRDLVASDPDAERFMPKVVLTLLALTHHHMEVFEEMPEDLRIRFVEEARSLLATFPVNVLEKCVRELKPERRQRLSIVLAGDEGRQSV